MPRQRRRMPPPPALPSAPEPLPLTIDRHRIRLRPTAFGNFVAAILATMLIGALNYNNNPALLLALLLVAGAIASATMAHLQLAGLRLETIRAEPVAAGQPLRLQLTLSDSQRRPRRGLRLQLHDHHVYCDVPASTRVSAPLMLTTHRRGWLRLNRIRLSTTQPLGLIRAEAWLWPQTTLLVHPCPEANAPPLPDGQDAARRQRPARLGAQLQQLRGYREGDPVQAISWKHSARLDRLLVREFEAPAGTELTLDWQGLMALPHERRIARLTQWVENAERRQLRYRLCLPGLTTLGPDRGDDHRRRCLRALALLPHG